MDVECQIHPLILVFIKNVYAKVAEKRSTVNRYKKLSYCRLRDELCQWKSRQLLHNCRHKLYSNSTTNQSNGVTADPRVIHSHEPTTRQLSHRCHHSSASSTVDKFRWQRDRLSAAKFPKFRVWGKVQGGMYPHKGTSDNKDFRRCPTFLITQCIQVGKKASMSKTSSIRPVVSIQYQLVTDRQTEEHTTAAYTALA